MIEHDQTACSLFDGSPLSSLEGLLRGGQGYGKAYTCQLEYAVAQFCDMLGPSNIDLSVAMSLRAEASHTAVTTNDDDVFDIVAAAQCLLLPSRMDALIRLDLRGTSVH